MMTVNNFTPPLCLPRSAERLIFHPWEMGMEKGWRLTRPLRQSEANSILACGNFLQPFITCPWWTSGRSIGVNWLSNRSRQEAGNGKSIPELVMKRGKRKLGMPCGYERGKKVKWRHERHPKESGIYRRNLTFLSDQTRETWFSAKEKVASN